MTVSTIVATAKNRVIGKDGQIPWYLPADLKYFKRTTLHHHIIMGRGTLESIGRPLPKRTNIVLTRNPFYAASNVIVVNDIEQALSIAYDNSEEEVFIIGGGTIYEQTQQLWDKIYLTEVDVAVEGDTFFPEIKSEEWKLLSSETHQPDAKNEFVYTFKVLERVNALNG